MDGINRIVMLGIPGSGKRSLISAIVHTMTKNTASIGGKLLSLRTLSEDELRLKEDALVRAGLQSQDRIKPFDLEKAFRKTGDTLPHELDLQLNINSQNCGRVVFMNLNPNALSLVRDAIRTDGISAIVVLVDADRVLKQDAQNIQKLADQLEKCLEGLEEQPKNAQHCIQRDKSVEILFALTKADLVPEERRGDHFTDFFEEAERLYAPVCSVCRTHGRSWHWIACSAANMQTDRVFQADGRLQPAPDFTPWNVDKLVCFLLYQSGKLLQKRMDRMMSECTDSIRRRKGRYNKRNVRAMLELEEARTFYCKAVLGHAPLVNANRFLQEIETFWQDDVKEGR